MQAKEIETSYVKSQDQLADILTKRLILKQLEDITTKLRLDIYNPNLRGSVENN
jgi:hypothetical protein